MTFRDIYREVLSMRGIRLKDQVSAEEWADSREPFAAALMNKECPPDMIPKLRKLFGEIADQAYAPLRDRQ